MSFGGPQRESALERGALRGWKQVEAGERRPEQLEQAREGNLRLRLHAPSPKHIHRFGLPHGPFQQARLADSCLADKGEHAARAGARLLEQTSDRSLFPIPAQEHMRECTSLGRAGTRGDP